MACTSVEDFILLNSTNQSSYDEYNFNFSYHFSEDDQALLYHRIEQIIYTKVILAISLLGIIGNLLNIFILTRKSMTTKMERLEKSAHYGLVSLALSDLLFCLAALPHALQDPSRFETPTIDFWLLYDAYGGAVVNTFLLSSTWLTVAMAVSRYIAVCHPLKARSYLGLHSCKIVIGSVFVISALFNLPRFFKKKITTIDCVEGEQVHYTEPGFISTIHDAQILQAFTWTYFIVGIALPLLLLIYCNVFLIWTLKKSMAMRQQLSQSKEDKRSQTNKWIVTLTLVMIITLYLFFVCPAEMLTFWRSFIETSNNPSLIIQYSLALAICNMLQAFNFAINFLLYCIINVQFRKAIRDLFHCSLCHQRKRMMRTSHENGTCDMYSTTYTSNTVVSTVV